MPYITDTSDSLAQLFSHAAGVSPHRLAGYAIHAAFWLGELQHCFSLLDGYTLRFEQSRQAEAAYLGADADPSDTTRSLNPADIQRSRRVLQKAATRFFEKCAENGLLAPELFGTIDELLELALYESAVNIAFIEHSRLLKQ